MNDEDLKHIVSTANRLRMIQADFADENAQTRAEYLREEIERALQVILPEKRRDFLEELMTRFPAGDFVIQPIKEQEAKGGSAIDEGTPGDPDFLVRRLLEIGRVLSNDRKELIGKRLQEGGFIPQVQQLKTMPQVGDGAGLDAARLIKLVDMLTDFVSNLDSLVSGTWHKLSPRSNIRLPKGLKDSMQQFICNDPDVSQERLEDELKSLRQLTAAIITAVSQIGGQFAKRHLAKLSPSEISALVQMERGSVLVSKEVKCWRKYLELADTLSEDSFETEVRKAIVDYVESLMKGAGRLR